MSDKILIIGTGAIGGFYGALLAQSGAEVSVVCRSDYETVSRQGFQIDSHALGRWRFQPAQVLRRAHDYKDCADYLILCSKVVADIDRVNLIRAGLSDKTAIAFIQNGVDIEAELLAAFPDRVVISGLAYICCNRLAPGHIRHLAYGKLTIGALTPDDAGLSERLRDLFIAGGGDCEISHDIIASRWQKCVWNAPFNPLSVLSGGLATQAILQNQENFVGEVMEEVCRIAAACGHPLADDTVDINLERTRNMPAYKTSMLLDFEQGRPMETEAILGNAIRAAQRHRIECPRLQSLYALMQLRELQIHENRPPD
ncbi:2-dehydropantoate 2-reductase [Methylomonas sp. EFPC3]|uniref:ketopantoate reductase family protein n=1 Tax=Methylomonas sp. EFPC3 TaxID=3021710 RepID=UPI002417AE4D|nr:2-dehydropantoate 2-reductase [Methylomonas sp. EFPC3]WFP49382.1 2-dehydropantoate 2-reductase [Methylomonas sp. EFPC3]